jgi:hypothetical protein
MIIHLSKDLAQFISDAVHAGFYACEDDVIRAMVIACMRSTPKIASSEPDRGFSLSRRITAPFAANGKVTQPRVCFSRHFAGETLASRLLNRHAREHAP